MADKEELFSQEYLQLHHLKRQMFSEDHVFAVVVSAVFPLMDILKSYEILLFVRHTNQKVLIKKHEYLAK